MSDSDRAAAEARRWWGRPLAELRWQLEPARLLVDPVLRGQEVARGDGRTVLLLPGFGVPGHTLAPLGAWLRSIGHRPVLGRHLTNTDCSDRALDTTERHAEALAGAGRRIAVVGHSRGGLFARALAARRPDLVSHAVSMGAGLGGALDVSLPTQAAIRAARLIAVRGGRARHADCLTAACDCAYSRDFAADFPVDRVRLTSIYSRGDGVVRWRSSIVPEADCVEVEGSHVGLIFNRHSYRALASALAAPELEPDRAAERIGGT